VAGAQALADEGNDARAARLASAEVLGTETLEEFVRRVRQVTPEDVWRVARTYLDPERAVLVVVGP
jgi:predicted Zn-dependent peptidase